MIRYRAERRKGRVKVTDTKTGLVGWYDGTTGDGLLRETGMPDTLNDTAVLDQVYWSIPYNG